MRVLIAPDTFTGTLTAMAAAEAIATGWARTSPGDTFALVPLADGGPGFVEVVHASLDGELITLTVTGPLGNAVQASLLLVSAGDLRTAYIESAQACGLHLIPELDRDPRSTTTRGVGELFLAAIDAGAQRIVVGLGGSGTNDAGAGLLAALGATASDSNGLDITPALSQGGTALAGVAGLDLQPALARTRGIEIVAASDVDNPLLGLRGATNGYARQKGADDAAVMELEGALESFAAAAGRRADGKDPAVALGSGAAGGLGYALLYLGANRVPGIATVLDTVRLAEQISHSDVVVTGEGSFDWQSLHGKVVAGVAAAALEQARPCVVLAGRVEVGSREYSSMGVSAAFAVVDHLVEQGVSADQALVDPAGTLASLAERVARTWGGCE
ncbi:MAG: glycerate kinase [Actinomycetes bacterium]